jgi:hypothetical protein
MLLHGLEQARLRLGRGPVDLIRQHQVREDRAWLELEDPVPALLHEDVRAGDVGRHEVRGELDAIERAVDDVGDRADQHRLAEAGHALEQHVAVREQSGQGLPDELALADDDLADFALDRLCSFGECLGREALAGVGGDGRFHGTSGSASRPCHRRAQFDGSSELK